METQMLPLADHQECPIMFRTTFIYLYKDNIIKNLDLNVEIFTNIIKFSYPSPDTSYIYRLKWCGDESEETKFAYFLESKNVQQSNPL